MDGDRLIGRGAYDMKGAAAAMMLTLADLRDQDSIRVRLAFVPDEETEEEFDRGSDVLVDEGYGGDFAITGEPTEMLIGVAAKGVLALRIEVAGRAAHGSTPWEGDNAITKAFDVFRGIESLPFSRQSSELFDRPSINLGRILGGDALNKVPDTCVIDVDIRYLPEQDPESILDQVRAIPIPTWFPPFSGLRSRSTSSRRSFGRSARRQLRPPRRGDQRGPRRRLRRRVLHPRRRPRGRVRPRRRRPPWTGRVGLDVLARRLPPDALRLCPLAARLDERKPEMSDERDENQKDEDVPPADDGEDKGGLGLTEEFARIESEIEREIHGRSASDDAADDGPEEDGESAEPREVRWDDDDSAEWPAPIPAEAGRRSETDEWSTAEEDLVDDKAAEEAADGVHSDEVPDEPVPPAPAEPKPDPVAEQPAEPVEEEAAVEPVAEEPEAEDEPDAEEPRRRGCARARRRPFSRASRHRAHDRQTAAARSPPARGCGDGRRRGWVAPGRRLRQDAGALVAVPDRIGPDRRFGRDLDLGLPPGPGDRGGQGFPADPQPPERSNESTPASRRRS